MTETDGYDRVTGLTPSDDEALLRLQAEQFAVYHQAAKRLLEAQLPAAETTVAEAAEALRQARAALEGPKAAVDRLADEAGTLKGMLAAMDLAGPDEALSVRLRARSERAAVEQELADTDRRLRAALRTADPLEVAVSAAQRELRRCEANLTDLQAAVSFPFGHPRGRDTVPWVQFQLMSGAWWGKCDDVSRGILHDALRRTGIGAETEANAIAAYTAGHPAALAAGGNTRRLPDGTVVVAEPGKPAVAMPGGATAQTLAQAPVTPTVPGPPAGDVTGGMRTGTGWEQPGR